MKGTMLWHKWLKVVSALMLGITVNVNAADTVTWKEEVALHDDNKIIVTRSHRYDPKGFREIGQPPPLAEATMTFMVPGTKQDVTWRSDYGRGYEDNLSLLLLDFVKGVPYIATHPSRCHAYNKWGRPNPPYVFFKYDGEWRRIPLEEFPTEFREANILLAPISNEHIRKQVQETTTRVGYVPIEKLKKLNRDSEKVYRIIAREPITYGPGNIAAVCGEMVYDGKGGWIGMGWFRKQPTYEACLKVCALNKVSAQYCPCSALFKDKEK